MTTLKRHWFFFRFCWVGGARKSFRNRIRHKFFFFFFTLWILLLLFPNFFFFFFWWNFYLPFCHGRFWQQTAPAAAVTTNNSRWRIFLMMRKHFVGFLFFSAGRRHLIPKSWLHIILCSNICCVVLRTNEAFLSRHCDMSYANRFFFFVCV